MKPLAPGDPVTVEGYWPLRLVQTHVDCWEGGAGFRIPGSSIPRSLADEGLTWIRGHHTDASPEGRALLAAALLVCG